MGRLRSPKTDAAYQKLKESGGLLVGCALCRDPSIHEFEMWRIIDNAFPYDEIAKVHHMLVPKRHVPDEEITSAEWAEFARLKKGYVNDTYEFTIEAVPRRMSIPGHMHLHLIVENEG